MCRQDTEGIFYGCGHYKIVNVIRKIDCESPYCVHSVYHKIPCRDCKCEQYFGPDRQEHVIERTTAYCDNCEYWFRGPGSIPRDRREDVVSSPIQS